MMADLRCLAGAKDYTEALEAIGHERVPEHDALIPEMRYYRKEPSDLPNTHYHAYMVKHRGDFWN